MKAGLTVVPLFAAIVAISSHAETNDKVALAQSEFLATAGSQGASDAGWRRHLETGQRFAAQSNSGVGGISAITPQTPRYASGCSQ